MSGSSDQHSKLVNETMLKIGALPFVRCWKRVVGIFYRVRFDQFGKATQSFAVHVNVEGEADIDGIMTRWDGAGIKIGIECKTGNARQNQAQKNYQAMLTGMGGLYFVVNTPEAALEHLIRERSRGCPTGK